jgi:NAD(P)-dependent dehydrogenase (short-subunit alcohol dehydrogenase family)
MHIKDRVFLISGGGSGLGAACARRLIAGGAKGVVIADVNAAAGEGLAGELGAKVRFVQADVTNEQAVQAAVKVALDNFGGLHGAINCAGIGLGEKIVGKEGVHRLESFKKVIEINLIGTFNVLRLAAGAMANNTPGESGERGVVVNTASIAAFDGQIGQCAYSASKGAIVGMTLPAARDLSRIGIRVVTIAPGIFDTPLLGRLPEENRKSLGAQVPYPSRLGSPDEFAALALHIIENQMLNGEVIRLDGALRMAPK